MRKNTITHRQRQCNKIQQNQIAKCCKNRLHDALKKKFIKEKFGLEHVAIAFYVLLAGLSISGIGNPFRLSS